MPTNDAPRRAKDGPGSGSESFLRRIVNSPARKNRGQLIALTTGLVLVVGAVDFFTGYELSMFVFYFVPICVAVAGIGWRFGLATAVASVATWLAGDYAAGAPYARTFVPIWNGLIALGAYSVLVWLLSNLLTMHREMEERVRQRTAALVAEIAERKRLEEAVLDISEREQRSIGRDLHDGLCQHLTGTALIGKSLVAQLRADRPAAAAEVERLVVLVETGIEQTRGLAAGLLLADIERDGLVGALQELAADTRRQFGVSCQFHLDGSVAFNETGPATHLYRIAQEAVRNAVRHGRARQVRIALSIRDQDLELTVADNGVGLPQPGVRSEGLGLRIMAHRAALVGGTLAIGPEPEGWTTVRCRMRLTP